MFFLIRIAFWFSLVLLFLPIWSQTPAADGESVGAIEALSAAQQAVSDISGICERKPDVCKTGRIAAQTIGVRARESARVAYQMIEEHQAADDAATEMNTEGFIVTPPTAIVPTPRPAF